MRFTNIGTIRIQCETSHRINFSFLTKRLLTYSFRDAGGFTLRFKMADLQYNG